MSIDQQLAEASSTINHRFLMLAQALSGIRALTKISLDLTNEDNLLRQTLDVIAQNLDFESCSIFLIRGNEELVCVAGMERGSNKASEFEISHRSHTFRIGEGIIGQAAKHRKIYYCDNCKKDKNFLSIVNSRSCSNVGSLISIPILNVDELLGVLNFSHPEPEFFHTWQEHIFSIHADILAQMLYNHRLMQDMATQVQHRTQDLQSSLDETRELKIKYQALSVIDDLTQIYNRRYFFSEVPAALARAIRYKQSLHLLFLDLDHFKHINDTYGHDTGDKVLKDIAAIISKQSRKGDILARMGGEEFAIAVPNTSMEGVELLATRIREAVAKCSWQYDEKHFGMTLSIGVSYFRQPEEEEQIHSSHINEIVHVLIREADQALYQSKKNGRDMVTFHDNTNTEDSPLTHIRKFADRK